MDAGGVILGLIGVAISLIVTYYIIKAGVRNGMREHQEWLDQRAKTPEKASTSD